jgi:hypothetical protein
MNGFWLNLGCVLVIAVRCATAGSRHDCNCSTYPRFFQQPAKLAERRMIPLL